MQLHLLALCAAAAAAAVLHGTAAHPGALACGDPKMALGKTIMKMKVTAGKVGSAKLTFSPASYTAGTPVTVTASGWPKGAYMVGG